MENKDTYTKQEVEQMFRAYVELERQKIYAFVYLIKGNKEMHKKIEKNGVTKALKNFEKRVPQNVRTFIPLSNSTLEKKVA
jgi:hypothetical protein